jgi:glycosyltransferase involved in cell wall biosynthesis
LISVLIPVRDGGELLVRCLEAINSQVVDDEFEVVIVDSGSLDGSVDRARSLGARVYEIPASEFHHGRTRNLLASHARGDVLVWTSHDAVPQGTAWLDLLTAPLRRGDAGVGAVYGRQAAHADATPPERYFLDFLYGPEARVQSASSVDELTMETTLYSNANSAMPRSLLEKFPFAEDVLIAEDQDWSRRVLLDGWSIVYEPRAVVRHSHRYTIGSAFKRFFESGVAGSRTFLAGGSTAQKALRRKGAEYALGELRWMASSGNARWIPYTCVYEGMKFVGIQLGHRQERVPRFLKRRWTNYPWWFD